MTQKKAVGPTQEEYAEFLAIRLNKVLLAAKSVDEILDALYVSDQ
jgi:predicted negative regulator of RcsB-dependent stress response